jgi:hypothetical protein
LATSASRANAGACARYLERSRHGAADHRAEPGTHRKPARRDGHRTRPRPPLARYDERRRFVFQRVAECAKRGVLRAPRCNACLRQRIEFDPNLQSGRFRCHQLPVDERSEHRQVDRHRIARIVVVALHDVFLTN